MFVFAFASSSAGPLKSIGFDSQLDQLRDITDWTSVDDDSFTVGRISNESRTNSVTEYLFLTHFACVFVSVDGGFLFRFHVLRVNSG